MATLKLNHVLLLSILVKIQPVADKLVSLASASSMFDRHMHAAKKVLPVSVLQI